MTKLILVIYTLNPESGSEPGVGWAYLEMCLGVAKSEGMEVYLLTSNLAMNEHGQRMMNLAAEFNPALNLNIKSIGNLNKSQNHFWNYLKFWWLSRKTIKSLTGNQISQDIVIHHVNYSTEVLPPVYFGLDLRSKSKLKKIWGPVGSSGNWKVGLLVSRKLSRATLVFLQLLRDAYVGMTFRFYSSSTDLCVVTSRKLVRISKSRNTIWQPNYVGFDSNNLSMSRGSEIKEKPTSALFVSRLVNRKMPFFACEIWQDISSKGGNLSLDIYGEGLLKRYLMEKYYENILEGHLVFHGSVNRESLLAAMRNHKFLIHPAMREGSPWVIGECLSLGIPIITFEGTGAAELMEYCGITEGIVSTNSRRRRLIRRNFKEMIIQFQSNDICINPKVNRLSREEIEARIVQWYEFSI